MDETATPQPEESRTAETAETEKQGQEEDRQPPENDLPDDDIPLPPPTFPFLVMSLRSQAEMQLGLLHFGEEKDRPKPHLPLARHTIDTMAMLQEKTRGNLSLEESRMLENALTELRFRFVQVLEAGKKGENRE